MRFDEQDRSIRVNNWVWEAARLIKFRPDREKVERELFGHMDDLVESYMSAGMNMEDASKKAVEAMGDPDEVAKQLALVHRPFWGRLAKATKTVGIVLAIILAWKTFTFDYSFLSYDPEEYFEQYTSQTEVLHDVRPEGAAEVGDYKVEIDRIVVCEYDGGYTAANFTMKISNINPWAAEPMFYHYIWAEDDRGNVYPYRPNGLQKQTGTVGDKEVCGNWANTGPFSSWYEMWVSYIDPQAEAITFKYDRLGYSFELRVDLTGGEAG